MKNNIFIIIITIALSFCFIFGCQNPDDLQPSVSRDGLNSVTARFEDGTGEFTGYLTEESNIVTISIPYYYPESSNNQVTEARLKRMRVSANLDDNVTVSPALLYMDMTQDNVITITDQRKEQKQYIIKGEIRRNSACLIEEFKIPSLGISGVINESTKTISIISIDNIAPSLAEVTLSYHATISPDPRVEVLDFNSDVELTVTAHDGVSKSVYTVKKNTPNKIAYGVRPDSYKLLFAKKLQDDLGITVMDLTGGMAVTKDHVVLNTRDQNSIYINSKTGEKVGEVNLGAVRGGLINFYNTADSDGNILINNLAPNAGTFQMWRLSSVTGTPELYIDWTGSADVQVGRKVSIMGSLDGNAIVTAPFHNYQSQFARWIVVNGVLQSQNPELIAISGVDITNTNIDVIYTSATNPSSDYFVIGYASNQLTLVDGTINTVKSQLDQVDQNYISNAVDYANFNGANYVAYNHVNPWNWGAADKVWLINTDGSFAGNPNDIAFWQCPADTYGSKILGNLNGNYTGDVAFRVSDDGFYLYLYFMFTNGYVVGVQFDCIEM